MTKQGGVRPSRVEWTPETTTGVAPSDIAWNLYSDNNTSLWDWEPDANTQRQDAAGEITAQGFFNGSETHDLSFNYDLQQWFVDGSGNTLDATGDFLKPSVDNSLKATHTIVSWSEQASGGASGNGQYIVTVAKGAHPDSATFPFNTDDGSPINVEAAYQAEKVRQYALSQPDSGGETLTITNNGSSSVDVAVENYDASQQNTVSVGAGSSTTTVDSYSSLGAVEKQSDVDGTVVVEDSGGTALVTLYGSDAYPAGEGDLGVPITGSGGSHADSIASGGEPSWVRFNDDSLAIPNVEQDIEIVSGEFTVETGLADNSKVGSARRNIHPAEWSYTVTATLAGSRASVDQTQNYLQEQTGTITWTAGEGSIDFNEAFIQSPGTYTKESGNGKMQFDNEFAAQTITIN